jgi:hypothetical protein
LGEVARHRRLDLLLDLGEQIGLTDQHEPGDREPDHQQREQREDGEVSYAGCVEVALAVVVPPLSTHGMVEPAEARPQAVKNPRFGFTLRLSRKCHPDLPNSVMPAALRTLTGHIPA